MKKAIIIGATSGIGEGLAQILADNDYKVGITGRRMELLDKLKSEKPSAYKLHQLIMRQKRIKSITWKG